MKILWIVPKWTLPTIDGATVATDKLIRNFESDDLQIDLTCVSQESDKLSLNMMQKDWPIKQVYHAQRGLPANKWGKAIYYGANLFRRPGTPLTMSSFQNKQLRQRIEALILAESYDWVVLDGLHLGAIFVKDGQFVRPYGVKFLYRAHNVESDLWFEAAEKRSNPFVRSFLASQGKLVERYEKLIVEGADLVAPISKEDEKELIARYSNIKTKISPLGLEFSSMLASIVSEKRKRNLLFLGRLDWEPNKEGLDWFLKKVWPRVNHDKVTLTIAGSGNGNWLESHLPLEGVTYLGFAEDKNALFEECDLALAPVFFGSGTRIKVVEPYSLGRPVITSKAGAKGSDLVEGEDYIEAKNAEEWIEALNHLEKYDLHRMAMSGADRLRKTFDEKSIALSLLSEMKNIQGQAT